MRLGIAVGDNWDFFHEIYADLQANYQTRLFEHRKLRSGPFHDRINQLLFRQRMTSLLASSDVALFEWASNWLSGASVLPKRCAMVTRLHRYELYQWTEHIHWDVLDRIILVSAAKQREFCAAYPAQAAKTVVINPGVALDKFVFRPKPFAGNIGILCHMTPRKRVYELILAFAEIIREDPQLYLHIGGDPIAGHTDYWLALHQLVDRLGLRRRVKFHDKVEDAWNWYHQIDIFVSMSYSEGLQVTPMEAMACGCYTLAHHWDGADELAPAANLFVSESQLQQKVLAYCALPEAAKQEHAQAMRDWACHHFDMRQTIKQFRFTIDCAAQDWQQANR
jgi:glycosyltransferase involved in cell wall biosynthesis